ncbi:glycosyltransferase family 1 protein [soil metagenome]
MKVAFNARVLDTQHIRGFSRYTLELLSRLPDHGVRPILYSINPIPDKHLATLPAGSFDVHIGGRRHPLLWDQFDWGKQAHRHGADLLHAPGNFGLPVRSKLPKVLTLHDAIDYVYYLDPMPFRTKLTKGILISRWLHGSSRIAADHIITDSEHARGDLIRRFGIRPARLSVTYLAADAKFTPASDAELARVRKQFQLSNRYVFYIGGWERRKNVPFLLKAFAAAKLADVDLVLAGGGVHELRSLQLLGEELKLGSQLKFLGRVDDGDLAGLYSGALAFVNPSEYEGFGLQLCEAMACHTPTLVANATCLPEVLGDGGAVFPLATTNELAAMLHRLANDDDYRQSLSTAAAKRSPFFSWDRCAEQTAAIYRTLIAQTGTNAHG